MLKINFTVKTVHAFQYTLAKINVYGNGTKCLITGNFIFTKLKAGDQ